MKRFFASTLAVAMMASVCSSAEPAAAGTVGQLSFGWACESITPDHPVAIGGQYHTRISGE